MEANGNFFYYHICNFCKIMSADIKTCSRCKLVSYCSQTHQRKEWKNHKPLCLSVQCYLKECNITNIFCFPVENINDWRRNRLNVMCAVELKLQRPLKIYEKQFFLFPNVCPVCYIFNSSREHSCEHCHCTRYCSSQHKFLHFEEHKKECLPLKLCYEVDKLCFDSKLIPIDFKIPYHDESSCLDTMDSFLTKYARSYTDIAKILLSEHLSGALSLLSVINCDYLRGKDKLNVHIIGASSYEQSVLMSIELLFHWFDCLNKVKLVLIGPEICENYVEPQFCELCSKNKIFIFDMEKKLYHQYIESKNFSVPDVIFSFNCGFSEFVDTDNDTWKESIQYLWNFKNGLFVFTSYTESEAKLDFEAVMKTKPKEKDTVKLTVSSSQNSFKSLRPHRNWEYFESSVFYNNNYITMMKIKA